MLKTIIAILTILIFINGCYTKGNTQFGATSQKQINQIIIKDKTTKNELIAIFGKPTIINFDSSGKEMWIYEFTKSTPNAGNFLPYVGLLVSGTNDQNKRLVVLFNNDSTVQDFFSSEFKNQTKTGILVKQN